MNQFKDVTLPPYLTCKLTMGNAFTVNKKYKVEGYTRPNFVWIISDKIDPADGRAERFKFKISDYDYYFDDDYGLEMYFYTEAEVRKLKIENLSK